MPSPTGELIAVKPHPQSDAQAVEIWDARTGEHVGTLAGQTGEVNDIEYSADGTRIATSSGDGTIRLWDPHSGEQQIVLRGHGAVVPTISFTPDGTQLASYGAEGVVRIWALDLDDLTTIAQNRVTRGFSDEECRHFLHTADCADVARPTATTD